MDQVLCKSSGQQQLGPTNGRLPMQMVMQVGYLLSCTASAFMQVIYHLLPLQ